MFLGCRDAIYCVLNLYIFRRDKSWSLASDRINHVVRERRDKSRLYKTQLFHYDIIEVYNLLIKK